MTVLPTYTPNSQLDDGTRSFRPADTGAGMIGHAAQQFGNQVSKTGLDIFRAEDALSKKLDALNKQAQTAERHIQFNQFQASEFEQFTKEQEQASVTGTGFASTYLKGFNERFQKFTEGMDPEDKLKWQEQGSSLYKSFSHQAVQFEHQRRMKAVGDAIGDTGKTIINNVKSGYQTVEEAKTHADNTINDLQLKGPVADETRKGMHAMIEGAYTEKFIKDNPALAFKELTAYTKGTVKSDNPLVGMARDAALRFGVDPALLLAVGYRESNLNPKTVGKGTSAFGAWQMTNDNWKELGVTDQSDPRKQDPAFQAEMSARLFERRVRGLQANGIEVTPQSFWGVHWLGPAGYMGAVKQDPNMEFRAYYSRFVGNNIDQVMANNGWKQGVTVGQVLGDISRKANDGYSRAQVALGAVDRPDPSKPVTIGGKELPNLKPEMLGAFFGKATEVVGKMMDETLKDGAKAFVAMDIINGNNPSHVTEVDKNFKANEVGNRILKGDNESIGAATGFAAKNGFLPPDASSAATKLMDDPSNKANKEAGYKMLLTAHDADPVRGLRNSEVPGELRTRIELTAAFRDQGAPLGEAVARAERALDPKNKKASADVEQAIKDSKDGVNAKDLFSKQLGAPGFFAKLFGSKDPRAPENKAMVDYATDIYQTAFTNNMRLLGGDVESAKALAASDLKKVVSKSTLFGRNEIGVYAADATYPPVQVQGADGKPQKSWKYIEIQAQAAIDSFAFKSKQAGNDLGTIEPKNIFLRPTADAPSDLRAGRPPRYDILFLDAKGRLNQAQGAATFDPTVAVEQTRAAAKTTTTATPAAPSAPGAVAVQRNKQDVTRDAVINYGKPTTPGANVQTQF